MKKFMTVLLVIAVMFTFSFSTAFAAAPNATEATRLAEAKAYAENIVAANYDAAYKLATAELLKYAPTHITVKEAWAKVDVKAALQSHIEKQYLAAATDFASYTGYATKETLAAALFATTNGTISEYNADGTVTATAATKLAAAMYDICEIEVTLAAFEADRQAELAKFDKVDYSIYSATEVEKTSKLTYLALAEKTVAEAKADLAERYVFDAETFNASDLVYLANFMDFFKNGATGTFDGVNDYLTERTLTVGSTTVNLGVYSVNGIATQTQVEAGNASTAAAIAVNKAEAAKAYAQFVQQWGTSYKSLADAWLEVVNALAEEGVLTTTPAYNATYKVLLKDTASGVPVQPTADTTYAAAVKEIAGLKAFAEKYKAEKDAAGALVRDAKEVDDIVAEYTIYKYATVHGAPTTGYTTYASLDAAQNAIIGTTVALDAQKIEFAKEVAKTLVAENKAAVISSYYALEAAKVEANCEKALAKIAEAKTVTAVQTAYTTYGEKADIISGIDNKTTVDGKIAWGSNSAADAALNAVNAYITYANSGKTVLDAGYIKATTAAKQAAIAKVYGEAGARKVSEMKAVTVDAAAIVAELPTVGAIAAAKTAAEDAIKALPATITVADQEAVVNAHTLTAAYAKITKNATGTEATPENQAKLDSAKTALHSAMMLDITKKIAAVDKTDKAALRALKAEIKAANKLVAATKALAGKATFDATGIVAGLLDDVRDAELAAVEKAINAIPVNVTVADKAVVEAARAAYDAFVADWTVYEGFANYNAVAAVGNFRTLALAEATVGLNDNSEEIAKIEAIAAIEGLKIKANSSAKKGSITVKWTVSEEVEGVKYQVYKSTKAQKGYKKSITTSKTSFKNTKNIEKGTRYYYKVRAIGVVDGVTYYSDWSNKANRIAK